MIRNLSKEALTAIEELLLSDFSLGSRCTRLVDSREIRGDIDHACSTIVTASEKLPLVYTAYDGDHFQLCSHMRRYVISHDSVPANPESVLGYKDTVSARLNKRGVLVDDLAVLSRCDELWVFTDQEAEPSSVRELAEGVVVELLFFLKRHPYATINFVSSQALLRGAGLELLRYQHSYAETVGALAADQEDGVLDLANSGDKVDQELPSIVYYIIDPLDFKYSDWLRPRVYEESALAPLVPGLAAELRDFESYDHPLTRALIAWARLLRMANVAWVLPPMDGHRKPSAVTRILECAWARTHGGQTLIKKRWADYPIPKARARNRWPLTAREGGPK
jgi:hypothetical protein